jgi:hypothetical protein
MRGAVVLAAILPMALLGCGNNTRSTLPIACVQPTLVSQGADLTRYAQGAGRDLTAVEFDARLAGLNGSCAPGRGERSIVMSLTAEFSVERGPAATSRIVRLPWFVAVVDAQTETILNEVRFVDQMSFERNETRQTGASEPVQLVLPVGDGRRMQDYRIMVSFQLTPEELAENRRRGPR